MSTKTMSAKKAIQTIAANQQLFEWKEISKTLGFNNASFWRKVDGLKKPEDLAKIIKDLDETTSFNWCDTSVTIKSELINYNIIAIL